MSKVTIKKMLFDRQESFNDVVSCLISLSVTGTNEAKDRLISNLNIINNIDKKCKEHGFDPAQFDQVQKALEDG